MLRTSYRSLTLLEERVVQIWGERSGQQKKVRVTLPRSSVQRLLTAAKQRAKSILYQEMIEFCVHAQSSYWPIDFGITF